MTDRQNYKVTRRITFIEEILVHDAESKSHAVDLARRGYWTEVLTTRTVDTTYKRAEPLQGANRG